MDLGRDDAIYILLPHQMYKQYTEDILANQDFEDIIIASVLYPYLAQAITEYDEVRDKSKTWADALKGRVDEINKAQNKSLKIRSEDAFEIAKLILKQPHERLFYTLVGINASRKKNSII